MIVFRTEIQIKGKTTGQIYNWLLDLDNEKYERWHPEHRRWRTIKREPGDLGNVIYFDEKIGRMRFRVKGKIVEAEPGRRLVYKLNYPIPTYLSLEFVPADKGVNVIHEVKFGYKGPMGKVLGGLVRRTRLVKYFEKELDRHARQEFKNLETIIG